MAKKKTNAKKATKKATKTPTKKTPTKSAPRRSPKPAVYRRQGNVQRAAIGTIGQAVRKRRLALGMSQKALSDRVGCGHAWISGIELGQTPGVAAMATLNVELGFTAREKAAIRREHPQFKLVLR